MDLYPHRLSARRRLALARSARRRRHLDRSLLWRLSVPAAFLAAGLLFVTSMVTAGGTDLRAGRYDDLPGLASAEAQSLGTLRDRSERLRSEVDGLTQALDSTEVRSAQARVEALEGPAGLRAASGPGVTISLDDAPGDVLDAAGDDVTDLIVHQQDIQAVANALWAGGAEAMSLAGERVVATTGIKCVGNTVILHGVPHSPPYRISAIGPISSMMASVNASPYIGLYLESVTKGLGWGVEVSRSLDVPAYAGPTDLQYATVSDAAVS